MSTPQRIAVIGAGAAGLTTAKTLSMAGYEVTVFDRTPDVGGVWSRTRRYPGVTTQSPRDTYSFSDFPMPASLPEWPDGQQVQQYFADYAAHFGVDRMCRLETTVEHAAVRPDGGWTLTVRSADGRSQESFDKLVVANGVFCEPAVPAYPGVQEHAAAGGRVVAVTEVLDEQEARDKDVLVIGYGKSACDIAVALTPAARSLSVIARQMLWKVPRRIGGVVNFKYLLLTRLGEALFRYQRLRGMEKVLHGPADPIRRRMVNSVGTAFVREHRVDRLGLLPAGAMEDIVKGAIGLVSEGFFEAVRDGRLTVRRDRVIVRLLEHEGRPSAELSDGSILPADLVVCATGFTQGVPFFDEDLQERIFDERSNFALYHHVLPPEVPDLYFAGYNSSFFSPLNAEIAAVWIANHLAGNVTTPDQAGLRDAVRARLDFLDVAINGHHCRGTKIIPFSMHNVDELLADLDANIPRRIRAAHWLVPVRPTAYGALVGRLIRQATVGRPGTSGDAGRKGSHPARSTADRWRDEGEEPLVLLDSA